jgi:hypothetical protein
MTIDHRLDGTSNVAGQALLFNSVDQCSKLEMWQTRLEHDHAIDKVIW